MAYDWGTGASGAMTGAKIGSAGGPLGIAIGGAVGAGLGFLGDGKKEDPYQSALRNLNLQMMQQRADAGVSLQDFYKTGNWYDMYQAGEGYDGALGSYDMTGAEKQGNLMLNNLLQQGAPELNTMGNQEFKDLLQGGKYDPMNNRGLWEPYMKEMLKQQGVQSDALDRNLAMTGDFYSSNRADQQRELGENTQDQQAQLLAGLGQQYMNTRLQGAETAANMGAQNQNMELQKIQASQQYGQLERLLKDQQAKEAYGEWIRSRSEYGDLINTANAIYGGGRITGLTSGSTSSGGLTDLLNSDAVKGLTKLAMNYSTSLGGDKVDYGSGSITGKDAYGNNVIGYR